MKEFVLTAEKRVALGKSVSGLRRAGKIPVVLYGHNYPTQSLQVALAEFKKVYAGAQESALVTVKIGSTEEKVLIHGVDEDPVTGVYRHADLYKVNLKEKIKTKVPVAFEGVSAAVKSLAGVLVKAMDEIEIECLPTNIPNHLVAQISSLATFDDVIKVRDIVLPEGVKMITEMDEVVASVTPPRSEAELESLKAEVVEDVQSVEGVKKEVDPNAPAATGSTKDAKKDGNKEVKKEKKAE